MNTEATDSPTVTVRDQAGADAEIPKALAKGPVHLRIEGMEGPIDLRRLVYRREIVNVLDDPADPAGPHLFSVTVSGGDKPVHPGWVRSIRDQCKAAGVPFRFESWGEFCPLECLPEMRPINDVGYGEFHDRHADSWVDSCMCEEGTVGCYRVGRERSGRMLDGREHDGGNEK